MSEVTVSVIVPCFNSERYIEETLDSIFTQSIQELEIIVVDDGSTDATSRLVKKSGEKVRYIYQNNQGVSAARNRGTSLAQGRYIQYLDADDLLPSDALEKRVSVLESGFGDVAYSDWQRLVETGPGIFREGEIVSRKLEDVSHDPEIATFTTFWAPPAAITYRRTMVDKIGGWSRTLPVIQDARFLFDAAANGAHFVHVDGIGAWYRQGRSDSLSSRSEKDFARDVYRNAREIGEIWKCRGGPAPAQRLALVTVLDYAARVLFRTRSDEFEEAVNLIRCYQGRTRFRFPEIAALLQRCMGHTLARVVLTGLVGMRSKFGGKPRLLQLTD